jgi:hypothetical protein
LFSVFKLKTENFTLFSLKNLMEKFAILCKMWLQNYYFVCTTQKRTTLLCSVIYVLKIERLKSKVNTVIIFLARKGRTRAVKFRPKNFGRISFDLGEISPNQQILRLSSGQNSPKLGEIRPKFLRANLNCADSPISNKFRPKKKLLWTFERWLPDQKILLLAYYQTMVIWTMNVGFKDAFRVKYWFTFGLESALQKF